MTEDFAARPKPAGLAENGTYTGLKVVKIDGRLSQVITGTDLAKLEATGHKVEVVKFERRVSPHAGRGAKD